MNETALVSNLVNAGVGGLIIIVVVLFLRFLTGERQKSNEQHETMMGFIKEQRESNNKANVEAAALIAQAQVRAADQTAGSYVQVAEAMKSLTVEIRLLKDSHLVHDTTMQVALDKMQKAKVRSAKKERTKKGI